MGVAVGDKVLLPECLLHSISLGILPLMFESSDNTERWFSRYGGQKITLGGDEYHLFREDDILVSTISGAHSSCVCGCVCAMLLVACIPVSIVSRFLPLHLTFSLGAAVCLRRAC